MIRPYPTPHELTDSELFALFGNLLLERIRRDPPPGTATEEDVVRAAADENRLCELIDGVLVEKTMGFYESYLALRLGTLLSIVVDDQDLGIVVGTDGMMRLMPGLVRIPDLAFISWSRLPGKEIPEQPIPDLVPDLAAEVLSKNNTRQEMARKLDDYFGSGVRLVWFVDPKKRTVKVFTSLTSTTTLDERGTLDGGDVVPGFSLPLDRLFNRPRRGAS